MLNFILGFFLGAAVADFLWAWKMGIVTLFWSKFIRFARTIFRK